MIQDGGLAKVHGVNHVFRILELGESLEAKTLGFLALVSRYSIVTSVKKYRAGWGQPPLKDSDTCEIETKIGPFFFWRKLGSSSWKAWREPTAGELNLLSDKILDDNANLFSDFFQTMLPEG